MTADRSDAPVSATPRRVVVTGAAGFIGSQVCHTLEAAGHEVVRFVRSASAAASGGVVVDLSDLDALVVALRSLEPDAICHAAWSGHPRSAGADYAAQLSDGLIPGAMISLATGLAGVPHLVLLSSGGGIGRPSADGRPPGAYGWAKHVTEAVLAATSADFGFIVTSLRPSAVYGPGQDPAKGLGVVSVFIDHVLRDEPVVLLGSGASGRDFLHVADLAHCIQLVIEQRAGGTFEVGGPEVVSLDELLELLEDAFGHPIKVDRAEPTGLDPALVSLDNRAIERATGWSPCRRLAGELPELVAHMADRLRRA